MNADCLKAINANLSSQQMNSNPFFAARPLMPLAAIFGDPHQALRALASLGEQAQQNPRHSAAVVCFPDDPDLALKMPRHVGNVAASPWFPFALATAAVAAATATTVVLGTASIALVFTLAGTSITVTALGVFALCVATLVLMTAELAFRCCSSAVELDVREALLAGHWAVVAHPQDQAHRRAASQSLRRYGGEVL